MIFIVVLENGLNNGLSDATYYFAKYWFLIPLFVVIFILLLDEVRKRRLFMKTLHTKPFQLHADTVIISILIGSFLYWLSYRMNFSEGILVNQLLLGCFLGGSIYLFWVLIRSVAIMLRNRKKDDQEKEILFLDQPITSEEDDRFSRAQFAQRITQIINRKENTEGLVIGLFGKWGSGKSSVLNLMKNSLANEIILEFNPWFFENEKELIRQFFVQFGHAIRRDGDIEKSGLIEKLLTLYGEKVAPLKINVGLTSVSIKQVLNIFSPESISADADITELRDAIKELLERNGRRITVFIDDIDRLNRKEIQTVFKLVKLIADFPFTTYVLAFDDRLVAKSLAEIFDDAEGIHKGDSFLEKIIQVPLHLPPVEPAVLRNMILFGIQTILDGNEIILSKEEGSRFVSTWDRSIGHTITTPRMVKKYLNTVMFSVPLLKNEVNLVDQILIEALRGFYPEVYDFVRSNPEIVLNAGKERTSNSVTLKEYQEKFKVVLESLSGEEVQNMKIFLQDLFPRTKVIFTDNNYYDYTWDKKWAEEQRVCSSEYFHRYFKYAIPADDIPDNWIQNILRSVESKKEQELLQEITSTVERQGMPRFIQKLRNLETSISGENARVLVRVLSVLGDSYSRNDGLFGLVTTWQQAAILIRNIIKNIPSGERVQFSIQVMEIAHPLPFAKEVLRWLRPSEKQTADDDVHSDEEIGLIAQPLIQRIKKESAPIEFLNKYQSNQDVYGLMWIWNNWGRPAEVEERITQWIKQENGTEKFLVSFLPNSYDMETGIQTASPFEKNQYDAIKVLIPPQVIFDRLVTQGKDSVSYDEEKTVHAQSLYKKTSLQFMAIHRREIKKGKKNEVDN